LKECRIYLSWTASLPLSLLKNKLQAPRHSGIQELYSSTVDIVSPVIQSLVSQARAWLSSGSCLIKRVDYIAHSWQSLLWMWAKTHIDNDCVVILLSTSKECTIYILDVWYHLSRYTAASGHRWPSPTLRSQIVVYLSTIHVVLKEHLTIQPQAVTHSWGIFATVFVGWLQPASPLSRTLQPAHHESMVWLLFVGHNNREKQRVCRQSFPISHEIDHADNQVLQTPLHIFNLLPRPTQ
jgi:hypothetical protein